MLFFFAGVCLAKPQPVKNKMNTNFADLLTYNNVIQKKCNHGPRVYALNPENSAGLIQNNTLPALPVINTTNIQVFTPSPLINFYKE